MILVQTTFDNTSSSALKLYADYHPQLDNDGMGNTGDTDSSSGELVAENGSVAGALTASTGFARAFIAAPTVPWGASVSADTDTDTGTGASGAHGYHAVWTRDEYEMATTLLAAGDKTDALAALSYIFSYEVESSGAVKQNTWLNGTAVFGSVQLDEVADPIILAYQLGATGSSDWSYVEELANYLVADGPSTLEERWEEIGGTVTTSTATARPRQAANGKASGPASRPSASRACCRGASMRRSSR